MSSRETREDLPIFSGTGNTPLDISRSRDRFEIDRVSAACLSVRSKRSSEPGLAGEELVWGRDKCMGIGMAERG